MITHCNLLKNTSWGGGVWRGSTSSLGAGLSFHRNFVCAQLTGTLIPETASAVSRQIMHLLSDLKEIASLCMEQLITVKKRANWWEKTNKQKNQNRRV